MPPDALLQYEQYTNLAIKIEEELILESSEVTQAIWLVPYCKLHG